MDIDEYLLNIFPDRESLEYYYGFIGYTPKNNESMFLIGKLTKNTYLDI